MIQASASGQVYVIREIDGLDYVLVSIANSNIKNLEQELAKLKTELKEAVEVITEFNEYREATDRKETSKSNTKWHTYERILYDKAKRFIANYRGRGEKNTTNE